MNLRELISFNLKRIRKDLGMNQAQFAEACEMSLSAIQSYEAMTREPKEDARNQMAKMLNISELEFYKPAQENVKQFTPNLPEVFQFLTNNHELIRMMAALPEGHLDMYRDIVEQEYNALKDKQEDAKQA